MGGMRTEADTGLWPAATLPFARTTPCPRLEDEGSFLPTRRVPLRQAFN
jgi:hypothetical protein